MHQKYSCNTMNNMFVDLLNKGVVVFLDDVLIYSITMEEYFELLREGVHMLV